VTSGSHRVGRALGRLRTFSVTAALVWALLPLALLDTVLLLTLSQGPGFGDCLWLSAYLSGQRALLVLGYALIRETWVRLPRRPPAWVTLPVVFTLAFGAMLPLFQEDLQNQAGWQRPLYVGALALGPLGIVGARLLLPWRWWLRAALAVGALLLVLANHFLFLLNYPGFHTTAVALSTLAAGTALAGDFRGPSPVDRPPIAGAVVLAAMAVWAVGVRPPTRISSMIVTQDALSLYRFSARAFTGDAPKLVERSENPYFSPRRRRPTPAGPAVVPRDKLIVVLITVDAMRYDAVSGEHRINLPTLNSLFAEGTRFTNAAVPAVSTTNSLVSLFTGLYYPQIVWRDESTNNRTIQIPNLRLKRFPQLLQRAGVQTFLGVTNWRMLPEYKALLGFGTVHKTKLKGYPKAEDVLPQLLAWVGKNKERPAFAYTHLLDAHSPYDRGGKHATPFQSYLREIEVLDRELGKLVEGLKSLGVWDRTVLIVGADHGEAFGEHGQRMHDGWLYQELTHVPLVIRAPGRPHRTVTEPVSLIDVGPTVLDLFGVSVPGRHMGQSLAPFLRNESPKYQRPVALYSRKGQGGILFPDLVKAIYVPRLRQAEVYDLKRDPKEKENRADEPWAQERIATVRSFFASLETRSTNEWKR
jgi:arylsulfatase A-like enzyme